MNTPNTTPSPAIEAVELPPLPMSPFIRRKWINKCDGSDEVSVVELFYDADQMRAYAISALAAKQEEVDKMRAALKEIGNMHHDLLVVMQAAWIDWQRGAGANSAMQWVHNTLMGPGLIPDDDEPYASEPQAYFDANKAEPFPTCFCGRPSNQLWMGKGFCGEAHYKEHRAALSPSQGNPK